MLLVSVFPNGSDRIQMTNICGSVIAIICYALSLDKNPQAEEKTHSLLN